MHGESRKITITHPELKIHVDLYCINMNNPFYVVKHCLFSKLLMPLQQISFARTIRANLEFIINLPTLYYHNFNSLLTLCLEKLQGTVIVAR